MTQVSTPEALRANYEHIWSTTDMRESQEYYARCLALARPTPGDRLLDVACGGGYLLMEAERAGLRTSGIDIADAALARARTFAPKSDLRRGDAEALPYADGSFEIVTCLGSLEHFLDPPKALEEMRRVLAPGGRAIVVVPNQWFAYDVARGWLEGVGLSHGQESERYFSIGQARDLIGAAFAIEHDEGWNPPVGLADRTRPFTGRWKRAALRVYGGLRSRLPIAMAYVFVFVGRHAPADAPGTVEPANGGVIPGGWNEREGAESRWTAGRAGVWLRLGSTVTASVLHDEPGDARLVCALSIEGEQIASAELPAHTWTDISAAVPERYRGTIQRVYLEPARTWSPFDHGTREDMRTLGVSVRRIASR
ncbi:MAG TPA: class I SAM-dependent methyltransferase [Candidatus Saccharimonadales bacterium]|jgi:SAM-dependent methyltransferase|nr:class I SAM-dependent methyltransferase [Candidatus Saccharimonadales bacterium]